MSDRRGAIGASGEDGALKVYEGRGFRLVARNWRCPIGELDLVVQRGELIVFCEVKTRSGTGFGGGYEAVTWRKQRKLRQLAELFLAEARFGPAAVRFDVASVAPGPGGRLNVELFEDAF